MGCVSSTLLNQVDEFPQIGGSAAFSNHIVSLTSTTYGLLSLDPSPPLPKHGSPTTAAPIPTADPQRPSLGSLRHQPLETINSWDLMSGLDSDNVPSFRYSASPFPPAKPSVFPVPRKENEENRNPNVSNVFEKSSFPTKELDNFLEKFETICPPNGENRVVLYTTTLRGVRKTFEDCNIVRSAIQGLGISICERDISMGRGFRDELRELTKGKGRNEVMIPPRLFVKGRYIGGVEEVMKIADEGHIGKLIQELPKLTGGIGCVCEGCGGVGFLPCYTCHGSCKLVVGAKQGKNTTVVRCDDCNENGLVLCPLCS